MAESVSLNPIGHMIDDWAQENIKGPVRMYDFGDTQTVMPVPDIASGSYLTTSICFLYLQGTGQLDKGVLLFRKPQNKVVDYGDGWKFIAVEIGYQSTVEQVHEALEKAKERLLQEIA
jgi:hypothetical protein